MAALIRSWKTARWYKDNLFCEALNAKRFVKHAKKIQPTGCSSSRPVSQRVFSDVGTSEFGSKGLGRSLPRNRAPARRLQSPRTPAHGHHAVCEPAGEKRRARDGQGKDAASALAETSGRRRTS